MMETRRGFVGKLAGLVGLGALVKMLPAEPTGFGGAVAEIALPERTYTLPATSGDAITRMWRKVQAQTCEAYNFVSEEYALLDNFDGPDWDWIEFDAERGEMRRSPNAERPIGSRSSDRRRARRVARG